VLPEAGRILGVMFDGRQYAQAKTTAWDRENTKPNPI